MKEYKVIKNSRNLEADINKYAEDGWELLPLAGSESGRPFLVMERLYITEEAVQASMMEQIPEEPPSKIYQVTVDDQTSEVEYEEVTVEA